MKTALTISNIATITNAPTHVITAIKKNLTFENPEYRNAKKFGRWSNNIPAELFFFTEEDNSLSFPRGFSENAFSICRQLGRITPEIIDLRSELSPIDIEFTGSLRPYQQEAANDMLKKTMGVMVADTGAGKTIILCYVIAQRKQPTLILVNRKELMYQFAEKLKKFTTCQNVGLIGDGKFDIQNVTVGIVKSVLNNIEDLPLYYGMLVVDECHGCVASDFRKVISAFETKYMYGVTATNWRNDKLDKLIYACLGNKIHVVNKGMLQNIGAVLKPQIIFKQTGYQFDYKDNYQELISDMLDNNYRNALIAFDIAMVANSSESPILVVSSRTKHCWKIKELLDTQDVSSVVITSKTASTQRTQALKDIASGKIKVIISTASLIGTGIDIPTLSSLFLSSSIKFDGLVIQVVGRVLRPSPSGETPVVYDYVDDVGVLKAAARARFKTYEKMNWLQNYLLKGVQALH